MGKEKLAYVQLLPQLKKTLVCVLLLFFFSSKQTSSLLKVIQTDLEVKHNCSILSSKDRKSVYISVALERDLKCKLSPKVNTEQ